MTHFWKRRCRLYAVLAAALLSSPLHAYPVAPFSAKSLLDRSDVVLCGTVISVKTSLRPSADHSSEPSAGEAIASVNASNWIKGTSPTIIDVVFQKTGQLRSPTQLVPGETALLFLKKADDEFRFRDEDNGALAVPPHRPLSYKYTQPSNRLVEELVKGVQTGEGITRLKCMEQLGEFATPDSKTCLQKMTEVPDVAVEGTAYDALIGLDIPPPAARLARFIKRRDDTKSGERFHTTGYSMGHLKEKILLDLADKFNTIRSNYETDSTGPEYMRRTKAAHVAAQRWKDFDLVHFLNVAVVNIPRDGLDENTDIISYRWIADVIDYQIDSHGNPAYLAHTFRPGSRRIACRLLNHDNLEVNEAAARAIDNMIEEKHSFPYSLDSTGAMKRYIEAARQWVKKHPRWSQGG